MKRLVFGAGLAMMFCIPQTAQAWGLKGHLWIAASTFADVADDCAVELAGLAIDVPKKTCWAIRANRGAFLAGAIGPDGFPDMMTGQMQTHPGIPEGWQSADWLAHLLRTARTDKELAFAWGYVTHAAGDMFAHSYVNNYAGEVFVLTDQERLAEWRHFRLEKFIDERLPTPPGGDIDPASLRVPEKFVADELMLSPELPDNALAPHLLVFRSVLGKVREAQPGLDAAVTARAEAAEATRIALARIEREAGLEDDPAIFGPPRKERWEALSSQTRRAVKRSRDEYDQADREWRLAKEVAAFNREWSVSIEVAAKHFVHASLRVARLMIAKAGAPDELRGPREAMLEPYRQWYQCHRGVMLGQPWQVGDEQCKAWDRIGTGRSFASLALMSGVSDSARDSFAAYERFRSGINRALLSMFMRAFRQLDPAGGALARDMLLPEHVDADTLNAGFRPNAAYRRFGFPEFECVSALIEEDMGIVRASDDYQPEGCRPTTNPPGATVTHLDPQRFMAFRHALTLARLALLDRAGLADLVTRLGADPLRLRLSSEPLRYSLLIDTVRSLDGSQQWKGQPIPFPRTTERTASIEAGAKRSYGYGPKASGAGTRRGFPLYADDELRVHVFAVLFPKPFEGEVLHPAAFKSVRIYASCPGDPFRPNVPSGATMVCER